MPGHHLAPPTEADVVLALRRHFGLERSEAIWQQVCREVGVRRTGGVLLPDDLQPIAEHLVQQEGLLRVVGQALRIRLRTYRLLAERAAGDARPRPGG